MGGFEVDDLKLNGPFIWKDVNGCDFLGSTRNMFSVIITGKLLHLLKRERAKLLLQMVSEKLQEGGILFIDANSTEWVEYRNRWEKLLGQEHVYRSRYREKVDPESDELIHRPFSEQELSSLFIQNNLTILEQFIDLESTGSFGFVAQKNGVKR